MLNFLAGGFFRGKRTYILGGILAAQAIAQWTTGDMALVELADKLPEILTGLGLMSLRSAAGK